MVDYSNFMCVQRLQAMNDQICTTHFIVLQVLNLFSAVAEWHYMYVLFAHSLPISGNECHQSKLCSHYIKWWSLNVLTGNALRICDREMYMSICLCTCVPMQRLTKYTSNVNISHTC